MRNGIDGSPAMATAQWRRRRRLYQKTLFALGILACMTATVEAQQSRARLEPEQGKVLLGAWLDTNDPKKRNDSFVQFNRRIGRNAAAFQVTQYLPFSPSTNLPGEVAYSDMALFDEDQTDAAVFMTACNPFNGNVTDADIARFADRVLNITGTGRPVFVHYIVRTSLNAAVYIDEFRRIATAVHSKAGDKAAMVWDPVSDLRNETEVAMFYPGDDYVDWIGLTLLYGAGEYAPGSTTIAPTPCPANWVGNVIDGGRHGWSFYNTYAAAKNKPFAITRGAAGFPLRYRRKVDGTSAPWIDVNNGSVSLADMQMSYWSTFLFNSTFRSRYPLFKLANLFEYSQIRPYEAVDVTEDFRTTTAGSEALSRFVAGLSASDATFVWASPVTTLPGAGGGGEHAGFVGAVAGIVVLVLVAVVAAILTALYLHRGRSKPEKAEPDVPLESVIAPSSPCRGRSSLTISRTSTGSLSGRPPGPASNEDTTAVPLAAPALLETPLFPAEPDKLLLLRDVPTDATATTGAAGGAKVGYLDGLDGGEQRARRVVEVGVGAPRSVSVRGVQGSNASEASSVPETQAGEQDVDLWSNLEASSAEGVSWKLTSMGVPRAAVSLLRESNVDGHALLLITEPDLYRLGMDASYHSVVLRAVDLLAVLSGAGGSTTGSDNDTRGDEGGGTGSMGAGAGGGALSSLEKLPPVYEATPVVEVPARVQ
ncbi:hypothetical protein HDU96_009967 [Phlyctochytrium bullatum]|nr:hypothetical protein HDU96_009967 [Phlyctochytrium bullatum]